MPPLIIIRVLGEDGKPVMPPMRIEFPDAKSAELQDDSFILECTTNGRIFYILRFKIVLHQVPWGEEGRGASEGREDQGWREGIDANAEECTNAVGRKVIDWWRVQLWEYLGPCIIIFGAS